MEALWEIAGSSNSKRGDVAARKRRNRFKFVFTWRMLTVIRLHGRVANAALSSGHVYITFGVLGYCRRVWGIIRRRREHTPVDLIRFVFTWPFKSKPISNANVVSVFRLEDSLASACCKPWIYTSVCIFYIRNAACGRVRK
jgi:hypothetical protein